MPTDFQLTPQTLNDLDEFWNHIAKDSMNAANRVESAILTACTNLAKNPLRGAKRIEISSLDFFSESSLLDPKQVPKLYGCPSARKQSHCRLSLCPMGGESSRRSLGDQDHSDPV
jgi:hypothetical protein